jgi:putative ABC transport system permease protein
MNLFQLILKQMRQRLLSTLLTCFSILLGMTLATSILILGREAKGVFAQTNFGFDLIVGPKASPLQLVLNTIYHIDVSPGNIPYRLYEEIATGRSADGKPNLYHGRVAWAVPYAVGDSYRGRRIVGTSTELFGVDGQGNPLPDDKAPHYRGKERYTFAQGRAFAPNKFEAVVGSDVALKLGLKIGDTFQATHGVPTATFVPFDQHPEVWTIVGILNETHTANDRVLFIPLLTFYAIFEHESGLERIAVIQAGGTRPAAATETKPAPSAKPAETAASQEAGEPEEKAYTLNPDGTINVKLPKDEWEISAILVQSTSPYSLLDLKNILQNLPDGIGVQPAGIMQTFFDTFLPATSTLLLLISTLVTIVAAVSILVSIYNSVTARFKEIAIMRALGATRVRILTVVCLEAAIVGTIGGVLGLVCGHLLAAGGSFYLQRLMGTGIPWWRLGWQELVYLPIVVAVSLLAGLVPALKAYQTPVAENL